MVVVFGKGGLLLSGDVAQRVEVSIEKENIPLVKHAVWGHPSKIHRRKPIKVSLIWSALVLILETLNDKRYSIWYSVPLRLH